MAITRNRREFLRDLGIGAASLPFLLNLPSLGFANQGGRKKRLVVMFSPDGVVPTAFWPDEEGDKFTLKESLKPLEPFKDRTLILHGVCDKIRGDGDGHMRGIGCLLTGIELFPGNIQGGSDTPAGWASGLSIDQEIKNYLQKQPATRTRFGSLEFGVMVPDRADTWTRMVYAGPNKPIAPIDDPYQMFNKLYGRSKDRESAQEHPRRRAGRPQEGRLARQRRGPAAARRARDVRPRDGAGAEVVRRRGRRPRGPRGRAGREARERPDPQDQQDADRPDGQQLRRPTSPAWRRCSTPTRSARPGCAGSGINEGQHDLSHKPDSDKDAQEKLTKINKWYCEQLAYLAKRLAETPEPGGPGSLLDNTTIVWTNELGKGNSHTLDNIPFVLVGNGLDFKMGRSLKYKRRAAQPAPDRDGPRAWATASRRSATPTSARGGPLPNLT